MTRGPWTPQRPRRGEAHYRARCASCHDAAADDTRLHAHGTHLPGDAKRDLIEYLKTR